MVYKKPERLLDAAQILHLDPQLQETAIALVNVVRGWLEDTNKEWFELHGDKNWRTHPFADPTHGIGFEIFLDALTTRGYSIDRNDRRTLHEKMKRWDKGTMEAARLTNLFYLYESGLLRFYNSVDARFTDLRRSTIAEQDSLVRQIPLEGEYNHRSLGPDLADSHAIVNSLATHLGDRLELPNLKEMGIFSLRADELELGRVQYVSGQVQRPVNDDGEDLPPPGGKRGR